MINLCLHSTILGMVLSSIWVLYTSDPASDKDKGDRVGSYFVAILIFAVAKYMGSYLSFMFNTESKYARELLLFC